MKRNKEDNKRLEYTLFVILKASDENKQKMKRIHKICDE
jgi:hypothetical protein